MKSSKFGMLSVVSAFVIAKSLNYSPISKFILFLSGAYLLLCAVIEAIKLIKTHEVENEQI